jgi:class 3 adenylate cyclase
MQPPIDDSHYNSNGSWWNPGFTNPTVEKEFRRQLDSTTLSAVRAGLGIIIFFWCGFILFDQFLSPSAKPAVLVFRFAIVTPLFLILGAISFSKIAAPLCQALVVLTEFLTFAAIIRVVYLYGDLEFLVNQFGLHLTMPSQDAKFIFVTIWILVVFVGSLSLRIRTRTVLVLSAILVSTVASAIYVYKPSAVLITLAGPFIFACILAVFAGSLKMQRLAQDNYRVTKLLEKSSGELEKSLEFLKTMFGRYLSHEVMASLIENPSALELGGEKRRVTIMMTDLRGFTALSERLEPEQVVEMLNAYFEIMVEVVLKFKGTINEIIGDALLVIFGAPQEMPNRAQQAIACAISMQNAMAKVNEQNRALGLPDLEMGIGLNETEVIVGNIGSSKRSKYSVVGSGVNMTSRIESYSVGGQVLVSESVRHEADEVLRIDSERVVFPKGAEASLKIYEIGGIAGQYNLAIEGEDPLLVELRRQIPLTYQVLEGKTDGKRESVGSVMRLSKKGAEIALDRPVEMLTNLKMNFRDVDENLAIKFFYGKVFENATVNEKIHLVRFTSLPPEIDAYFQSHRQHSQISHTQ